VEKIYKIHNLNRKLKPEEFEKLNELLKEETVGPAFGKAMLSYIPWEEFRKKSWATDNPEQVWSIVSFFRQTFNRKTNITDKSGEKYTYDPQKHAEFLHEVDMELGGSLLGISSFSEGDKRQIIRRNLIEESIASSKLEGANTSREAARRMLREGRNPKDKDERMIVNNHAAMTWIEETAKNSRMSIDLLLDLHKQVTAGTLAKPELEGRLRETFDDKGNRLKIMPWDETTVVYIVPDKEFVEEQLKNLIKFANDELSEPFIHPLIKAIMLHFWIGLLHPFEDGNGRLARIIFYWYMLKKGYWAFSYISLSERIIKSPKQYAMAYIYSEQDGFDLNYFIQYNVEKLKLARQHLQTFLKSKVAENKDQVRIAQSGLGLNNRQIRLLQQFHQDEILQTSVAEHCNINKEISYVSAVTDLKSLVAKGFLKKLRNGRNVIYLPTDKLSTLFHT
jgi:Fic family protein